LEFGACRLRCSPRVSVGFLEPSYNYSFSNGHEQSLGVTMGLLIPIQ